jgi:type IX secretion system PorP/SprF family membrane protein
MKIKIITLIISILFSLNIYAQHDIQSAFYPDQKFLINPANAGDHESPNVLLGYRNDFVGIPGALRRPMLGYHSPVTKNMGLGALIALEQVGVFNYYSFSGSYAYTVNLTKTNLLRMGISTGIYSRQVNTGKVEVDQSNDNLLQSQYNSDIFYLACAGAELEIDDQFFASLSIPKLYSGEDKQFAQTVIGGVAYKIKLEEHVITPSVYYYFYRNLPSHADINIVYKYADKFSLYGSVRSDKTFALGAGIVIKNLGINYIYEINTKLASASKGTHEILLSYALDAIRFTPSGRKLKGK